MGDSGGWGNSKSDTLKLQHSNCSHITYHTIDLQGISSEDCLSMYDFTSFTHEIWPRRLGSACGTYSSDGRYRIEPGLEFQILPSVLSQKLVA